VYSLGNFIHSSSYVTVDVVFNYHLLFATLFVLTVLSCIQLGLLTTLCPQKSIPDIFDCNLKTNYQILMIFGTNIPDTTCHLMTV